MKVVFMGTPEFAVPVLSSLQKSEHSVEAVVTVPDKLGGRSQNQLLESAVKKYAVKQGIRILQPRNLKSSKFLQKLREIEADVFVVVAFKKLPKLVWSIPTKGTINLHASLLPAYRGAAPINWAVINGETKSGMTTFFIDQKIDTGNILLQKELEIAPDETAGNLHDKMMIHSGKLMLDTLKGIENNSIQATAQDESGVTKAPKIFFDQNKLDFKKSTKQLNNFIRGMSPYPTAWIKFNGKILKIYKADPVILSHSIEPGTIDTDYKTHFKVYTRDGYLKLREVQISGKRKMIIKDFLNGLRK
ncbi:methionyl-tRNA formyltransferase [Membranihabitans maritimus]|uniref:methionyl-tRNA formyltransferase n=1 Tax=Membranihabitans maritimus TaxID=2904244 RepID=UPI001F0274FD|nr:methionyl-tRNA formyltransferase [Membranihabitans maritimus]